jgi:signal transduction histidine kinase/DNA-binding response OmpR family regulator
MSRFTLTEFIQSTPSCSIETSLDSLLALFQESHAQVVVVTDSQNLILGAIQSAHLLTHCYPLKKSRTSPPPPIRDLAEPLPILPVSSSLTEVATLLQSPDWGNAPCAVVDAQGHFLGLLAVNKLLPTLLTPLPFPRLSPNLLPLLEQLPIPLMVQTETGKILGKNAAWREQVEVIPVTADPGMTLGSNRWCNLENDEPEDARHFAANLSVSQYQQAQRGSYPRDTALSPKPDRVWQFVRLPLDTPDLDNPEPLWIVLATDVTEQQQLCKELAAKNADLVQLNRLKDEFLACISHELKTPLTAILGLSNLLKEKSLGDLNPRQARYAQMVYQSGRQLMSVVNDILDLTRLESGQLQLNPEPIQLKAVCDRAYQQALKLQDEQNQEGDHHSILFRLDIESGITTMIADELRLSQMLVHLLSNALKFTTAEGEIGLRINLWEGWIAFNIWDEGIGIPTAAQHLVFQKFQQLESPLTRSFEGTGLGLVLTQRLARAHGGDISFVSTEGVGSEFTLLLPPSPPSRNPIPTQKAVEVNSNRLVLLVEAVPQVIETLNEQLRDLGYRVAIARSGTEALEKARQLQPCLMLLNPLLPLLSGWDVLTLLKADPKTSNIPVLVVATRAEKQQAQQHQADGFLSLPVDLQTLAQRLESFSANGKATTIEKLILLHIKPNVDPLSPQTATELSTTLSSHPHTPKYRLLEVNDLDQANLLAQYWHPDLILLEGMTPEDLDLYAQQENLTPLPVLTLDYGSTEVMQKMPNLAVYPAHPSPQTPHIQILLQQIHQATVATPPPEPNLLVVGCWETKSKRWEWIQALTQYLQTAGYNTTLSHSWQEVYSQIHYHSVDLLILDLGHVSPESTLALKLEQLAQLPNKPLILVLDHCPNRETPTPLTSSLEAIATRVVCSPSQSMSELLAAIQQVFDED